MLKQPSLDEHLMNNVYFDTCVYHQPGIDLLAEVIETKNILFGSEMVGAVRGIDPQTGHYFDDTKRYVDALPIDEEASACDLRRQCPPRVPAARRQAEGGMTRPHDRHGFAKCEKPSATSSSSSATGATSATSYDDGVGTFPFSDTERGDDRAAGGIAITLTPRQAQRHARRDRAPYRPLRLPRGAARYEWNDLMTTRKSASTSTIPGGVRRHPRTRVFTASARARAITSTSSR